MLLLIIGRQDMLKLKLFQHGLHKAITVHVIKYSTNRSNKGAAIKNAKAWWACRWRDVISGLKRRAVKHNNNACHLSSMNPHNAVVCCLQTIFFCENQLGEIKGQCALTYCSRGDGWHVGKVYLYFFIA